MGLEKIRKKRHAEPMIDLLGLTNKLGLALALDKCTAPTQSITCFGFCIAVSSMMVTLPNEKVMEV